MNFRMDCILKGRAFARSFLFLKNLDIDLSKQAYGFKLAIINVLILEITFLKMCLLHRVPSAYHV
jgi:hypothetical protein